MSRWYAVIIFENRKFILKYTESKFGALLLTKGPIMINIG